MQEPPVTPLARLEAALPSGPVGFDRGAKRRTFLGDSFEVYRTPTDRLPKMTVMVAEKAGSLSSVTVGAADGRGMWIMTGRPDGAVSGVRSLPGAKQGKPFPVEGAAFSAFAAIVAAATAAGPQGFACDLGADEPLDAADGKAGPVGAGAPAPRSGVATQMDAAPVQRDLPAAVAGDRVTAATDAPANPEPVPATPPAAPVSAPGPARLAALTGNAGKAAEYARFFGRYGIRPRIVDPAGRDPGAVAAELLSGEATVVLREESDIFATDPFEDGPPRHLDLMDNRCEASTWTTSEGGVRERRFAETVEGYYDAYGEPGPRTFGWDANFVPLGQSRSLDASAALGQKVSARDLVLSRVVSEHFRFPLRTDMAFHPVGQSRIVDFSVMPHEHLVGIHWLSTPAFRTSMLSRILGGALSDGAFFRSAETRRERNYWWPGLNGGIPLVAKKDDVHELTFLFHDLMHAAMPDLVFDGNVGPDARRAYVAHRMVGEAISLVLADFLFVDTMARSGLDYDFGKRRIHPFFSSANAALRDRGLSTEAAVRELCRANAHFALTGDDAALRALGGDEGALEAYEGKYARFFAEDLRWTTANFDRLSAFPAPLETPDRGNGASAVGRAKLTFVSEFVARVERSANLDGGELETMSSTRLAETVFTEAWDFWFARRVAEAPKFGSELFDPDLAKSNAISRYMLGQSVMYGRFPHVPAVVAMGAALATGLEAAAMRDRLLDDVDLARMRRFHERAVDALLESRAISPEDARVYREVYPVFPPHFVFYDAKGEERPLTEVAAELIGPVQAAADAGIAVLSDETRLNPGAAGEQSVEHPAPDPLTEVVSPAGGERAARAASGFRLAGFLAKRCRVAS